MEEYAKELLFAKELARKAGNIIVKNFETAASNTKYNFTPVTQTDIAVSELVVAEVAKQFPDHNVLDEEINPETQKHGYVWICDPVDGTIPYAHKIPTSAFSLALCKEGEPVVGVMYDPFMNRLLYATEKSDAYLNDKKIHVNIKTLEKGSTIFTIPYWISDVIDYDAFYTIWNEKKVIVSSVESIVYTVMLIASGTTTAAIMPPAHPWDRAAALLILKRAGGKATDETGKPFTVFDQHNTFIATNSHVHNEILDVVKHTLKIQK